MFDANNCPGFTQAQLDAMNEEVVLEILGRGDINDDNMHQIVQETQDAVVEKYIAKNRFKIGG